MDLDTYVNIDNLNELAQQNGIVVPRLRGYRYMLNERPIDISEVTKSVETDVCKDALETHWRFGCIYHCSQKVRQSMKRYMNYHINPSGNIVYDSVKWDKIHGKHRKQLKFEIKKQLRAYQKQYDTFNKYVGRADVLYIHSRVGADYWYGYGCDKSIAIQPWFLEKVDDAFDSTYCDIYAKLNVLTEEFSDGKETMPV